MSDPLLTTLEIAERFRVSANTVRFWRYEKTGPPGIKVGQRVLYPESQVDAWVRGLAEEEGRRD